MLLKSRNKFEFDQRQRYDGAVQTPIPQCLRGDFSKETSALTNLTKRTVDAIENKSSDFVSWNDGLPGFALRVFKIGAAKLGCPVSRCWPLA
jgi:hypothetical protein